MITHTNSPAVPGDANDGSVSDQENRNYSKAEEQFLVATRMEIKRLLRERNIRPVDLARRLGISKARVSFLLSDKGTNLTVKFIARIFASMDEVPVLTSRAALEKRDAA